MERADESGTTYRLVVPENRVVIVDRTGIPADEVAEPPEGWTPVTEFSGTEFRVELNGNVLSVSGEALDPPVLDATVKLDFNPIPSGLEQRIRNATKGSGAYRVDYRTGTMSFSCHGEDPPAAITIHVDDKLTLLLSWDGKKLKAVLTDS